MSSLAQSLYRFFSGFGIDAYPASSIPEEAEYPYLTYEYDNGAYLDVSAITVNLWFKDTSEEEVNAKIKEISEKLGLGGLMLDCGVWLTRGTPFAQTTGIDSQHNVKHVYMNIDANYFNDI